MLSSRPAAEDRQVVFSFLHGTGTSLSRVTPAAGRQAGNAERAETDKRGPSSEKSGFQQLHASSVAQSGRNGEYEASKPSTGRRQAARTLAAWFKQHSSDNKSSP